MTKDFFLNQCSSSIHKYGEFFFFLLFIFTFIFELV